jgi:hypothetical protein
VTLARGAGVVARRRTGRARRALRVVQPPEPPGRCCAGVLRQRGRKPLRELGRDQRAAFRIEVALALGEALEKIELRGGERRVQARRLRSVGESARGFRDRRLADEVLLHHDRSRRHVAEPLARLRDQHAQHADAV